MYSHVNFNIFILSIILLSNRGVQLLVLLPYSRAYSQRKVHANVRASFRIWIYTNALARQNKLLRFYSNSLTANTGGPVLTVDSTVATMKPAINKKPTACALCNKSPNYKMPVNYVDDDLRRFQFCRHTLSNSASMIHVDCGTTSLQRYRERSKENSYIVTLSLVPSNDNCYYRIPGLLKPW